MRSHRSIIKKTIAPAIVLMCLVFFLSAHVPAPYPIEGVVHHTAKFQLEKELAIQKPRSHIAVSTEIGRAVQVSGSREAAGSENGGLPLLKTLESYMLRHVGLDLTGAELPKNHKWLVYSPGVVGWGNRLQGLYVGLAVSLLTNRTLLIDWTSPVPLTDLITLRPNVPLLLPPHHRNSLLSLPSRNANAWQHPEGYLAYPKEVLQTQDIKSLWSEDVVNFSVGEDWMSYLLSNPSLRDDILRVFGTSTGHAWSERSLQLVAHDLLSFLIAELSPAATALFERSSLAPFYHRGVNTVGVQIRIGTNNTSFEPFVDLEHDVPKFWNCVDSMLTSSSSKTRHTTSSKPTHVFLATDSHKVKEEALQRYGEKILFFDGPIVHSGNEQLTDEHGKDRDLDGLLKVVIDWWLLGESQVLFRSKHSTFGRSAAVRRPTPSIILPTQYQDGCPLFS